jgi:hypothetical protein
MGNRNEYYIELKVDVSNPETKVNSTDGGRKGEKFWKSLLHTDGEKERKEVDVKSCEESLKRNFGKELTQAVSRWEVNRTIPPGYTQPIRLVFSFENTDIKYGSLLLTVFIMGAKKLVEFFDNNPELLKDFLRNHVPEAVLGSLHDVFHPSTTSNSPDLEVEHITFSPSLISLFNQIDPSGNQSPIKKFWNDLFASFVIPVLVALVILILLIIAALETRQSLVDEKNKLAEERKNLLDGYQKHVELLVNENKNLMCALKHTCPDEPQKTEK